MSSKKHRQIKQIPTDLHEPIKLGWHVVYERAIREDGTLFFPEKLSLETLRHLRQQQGTAIFANQYLNEVMPDELRTFKSEWFRYIKESPTRFNRFMAVDPAISKKDGSDFTAVVIMDIDSDGIRYVQSAKRYRASPTEQIDIILNECNQWNPTFGAVEVVGYQAALYDNLIKEAALRGIRFPFKPYIPPHNMIKEERIRSLQPHFEWGRMLLRQGLYDLEEELLQFPRAAHDDLCDALAQADSISYSPGKEKIKSNEPHPVENSAQYEQLYRAKLAARANSELDEY